jgi:hypothetical protein
MIAIRTARGEIALDPLPERGMETSHVFRDLGARVLSSGEVGQSLRNIRSRAGLGKPGNDRRKLHSKIPWSGESVGIGGAVGPVAASSNGQQQAASRSS